MLGAIFKIFVMIFVIGLIIYAQVSRRKNRRSLDKLIQEGNKSIKNIIKMDEEINEKFEDLFHKIDAKILEKDKEDSGNTLISDP